MNTLRTRRLIPLGTCDQIDITQDRGGFTLSLRSHKRLELEATAEILSARTPSSPKRTRTVQKSANIKTSSQSHPTIQQPSLLSHNSSLTR